MSVTPASSVFDLNPLNKGKTVTGTTTAAYVQALSLYEGNGAIFSIVNSDASNNLLYKIEFYRDENTSCPIEVAKAETTVTPSGTPVVPTVDRSMVEPFYCVIVSVKLGTGAGNFIVTGRKY